MSSELITQAIALHSTKETIAAVAGEIVKNICLRKYSKGRNQGERSEERVEVHCVSWGCWILPALLNCWQYCSILLNSSVPGTGLVDVDEIGWKRDIGGWIKGAKRVTLGEMKKDPWQWWAKKKQDQLTLLESFLLGSVF